ncbi:ATP-binding protein [Streptomyces griseoviridis]|jgi:anti-sigma regulatory factor (Ser/Thr protein kinase)|uniref:Anti-sigma regulatory factor (Ser/Thr protein kinase) n=3 Tax=Streptomyces TaxID=1883 RepID=A0ABT9L7U9_STRGD|nr:MULTISPECIES: ATP-binding protein [Streptomyces]MDP9679786.1 anti-sigma regulatory factor (Ser/Thr protein kinase) [Streptomyces griseoviridis]GGS62927.1 ATP-binding protein [Streptomyces niveoruber]GGT24983.1 ATP-binding protein [Streptomyces griseoviridis]GGU59066.1 ATP-binding protein [Streptomyces daghestanicus]GHI30061.1 ATP-binding protein [Streptomyces daghestanicus]
MDRTAQNDDRLQDGLVWMSAAYEGVPGDIARARDLARAFLVRLEHDHGHPVAARAAQAVELVVSELLTNACKHTSGPAVLDLELVGDQVYITVRDTDPGLPVARPPDPTRVGRHGLEIVMALAHSFDVHREPAGKRTRAAVPLTGDPRRDGDGRSGLGAPRAEPGEA